MIKYSEDCHFQDLLCVLLIPLNSQKQTILFRFLLQDYFPIDIQLGDGGTGKNEPNVIITIDAVHMEGIQYGKPLYDIELVYAQDVINHPKKVVYRVMQGRFIITPNITR